MKILKYFVKVQNATLMPKVSKPTWITPNLMKRIIAQKQSRTKHHAKIEFIGKHKSEIKANKIILQQFQDFQNI